MFNKDAKLDDGDDWMGEEWVNFIFVGGGFDTVGASVGAIVGAIEGSSDGAVDGFNDCIDDVVLEIMDGRSICSSDDDTFEDKNNEVDGIGDGTAMVEGSSSSNFEFSFDVVR